MKTCDHQSVGVIITDKARRFLLLTRAKPPVGIAPVAGHVDEHGSPHSAGCVEAVEEAGVRLVALQHRDEGYVANICRRPASNPDKPGHYWWIYSAQLSETTTSFSADETRGGGWYTAEQLDALARRTCAYAQGQVPEAEWRAQPGLEPVWVYWLDRLEMIEPLTSPELQAIVNVFTAPPV